MIDYKRQMTELKTIQLKDESQRYRSREREIEREKGIVTRARVLVPESRPGGGVIDQTLSREKNPKPPNRSKLPKSQIREDWNERTVCCSLCLCLRLL